MNWTRRGIKGPQRVVHMAAFALILYDAAASGLCSGSLLDRHFTVGRRMAQVHFQGLPDKPCANTSASLLYGRHLRLVSVKAMTVHTRLHLVSDGSSNSGFNIQGRRQEQTCSILKHVDLQPLTALFQGPRSKAKGLTVLLCPIVPIGNLRVKVKIELAHDNYALWSIVHWSPMLHCPSGSVANSGYCTPNVSANNLGLRCGSVVPECSALTEESLASISNQLNLT